MEAFPLLMILFIFINIQVEAKTDIKVFTVATDNTHGLQRFLRSAKVYGIDVENLGQGKKWNGGDMHYAGGGQKINLLKNKLNEMIKEGNKDQIVLFTDSYDVLFLSTLDTIVQKFQAYQDTRVLFSAEKFCWPDQGLASSYPNDTKSDIYSLTKVTNPYLNSGGFIGYLPELAEIVNFKKVSDTDDDQLYYTNVYLNKELRDSLKIRLDHNSTIFQNLNGALSDVQLKVNTTAEWPFIENVITRHSPLIVHGNGPSKLTLNSWGNYLAKAWSLKHGCAACSEKRTHLEDENLPPVMMAVFIEHATPFFEEFLQQILVTNYPKSKIHLFLSNNVRYHEKDVDRFYEAHHLKFASAKRLKPSDFVTEADARNLAKDRCIKNDCEYIFYVDSLSRVEPNTLRYLISTGYDVIAPMLVRPGQAWSNFWGAINSDGFYERSFDYMHLVNDAYRGIWNVPYINNCYLVKTSLLRSESTKQVTYSIADQDPDMSFCISLRHVGIFMHVSNEDNFGHLINHETFDIKRTNPDVYQVIDNRIDWEKRYLNENYTKNYAEGRKHLQPCPDVYWFPVMSKRFCVEWIEIMEAYGKWSDGSNNDERLDSGYEAVPTRDIHMKQVGLERQWLNILKEYIRPLQELVFIGYFHNPPQSIMNFVVRYKPDEQPSLRPHHDASTYTINLALNTPHVDYEGGGCRFLRYDCTVKNMRQGWLLMHPGRLTHYHEGLQVTNGTRYIMISFVDP